MSTHDLVSEQQQLLELWRMEARARRAARRVGLVARKSRWRVGSLDNYGGFSIFDPSTNFVVYGWGYDLESEEVIEICNSDDSQLARDHSPMFFSNAHLEAQPIEIVGECSARAKAYKRYSR